MSIKGLPPYLYPGFESEINYGITGKYVYAPAMAMNANHDLLVVFNQSSTDEYPSIYATGRRDTDPIGELRVPAHRLKAGVASYQYGSGFGVARWGDVSGAAIDPRNGLDFWLAAEYADGDVLGGFGTWINNVTAVDLPP
jgi:hypothetical protein